MPIYALGSLPLLNITTTDHTKYSDYADDISCVGKLRNILTWWNKLNTFGAKMGYFPKANRSWLIVKPEKYETAKGIFKDTNLDITNKGKKHLGAGVGTEEFRKEYAIMSVNEWVAELKLLTKIAKFYSQATYCTFTSGFRQKFNYVIRTIPNISHLLQPIENVIREEFITSLFEGRTCNDEDCQILSLPVKLGGMGITNITSISNIEYQNSKKITKNLVDKIKNKKTEPVLTLKTAATNEKSLNLQMNAPSQSDYP